jgi:hypothetical protein
MGSLAPLVQVRGVRWGRPAGVFFDSCSPSPRCVCSIKPQPGLSALLPAILMQYFEISRVAHLGGGWGKAVRGAACGLG